jgi:Delta7-sterol 5-desaturase
LRPDQQRQALRLSVMNLSIGGLLSGTLIYGLTHGLQTPIYFDVSDYGWTYTLFGTVLYFLLVDVLAYYAHRLLHAKRFFKHVHSWHHRYVATTPWVVTAMHPVEFLFFQFVALAPIFVIPFHAASIIFVLVYTLAFNVIDHSGVKLSSIWPWQGPTTFHDDHHAHFHCNFGQHLSLWDRLHGTLRRKNSRYGVDVFGGRGVNDAKGALDDEFIHYS